MNLVEIIYALTLTEARMPAELPRGLHLVHYPAGDGQPARLIAARHIANPSPTELRIVRDALLDRLGFTARFGTDDDLDDDFPGLPVAAAIAVYRATGGELAPPSLTPVRESTAAAIAEVRAGPSRSVAQTAPPQPTAAFWRDALAELEMQMTRATFTQLLAGATATLTDDQLTIHVRNHYAADWLSSRLHDLITRTVAAIAGRPLTIRYQVRSQNE